MAKIEWKGGECPVSVGEKVKVWFRDGDDCIDNAESYRWNHTSGAGDIIAYEVIEEEPKQITEKTLRDEIAIAWLVNIDAEHMTFDEVAEEAYTIADAMMKARASILDRCTWNPPKPKTVMVELLIEDAEYYRDSAYVNSALNIACRKALEAIKQS